LIGNTAALAAAFVLEALEGGREGGREGGKEE